MSRRNCIDLVWFVVLIVCVPAVTFAIGISFARNFERGGRPLVPPEPPAIDWPDPSPGIVSPNQKTPRPDWAQPAEHGAGAGIVPACAAPVRGEPIRNAARDAELERQRVEYHKLYGGYGIDAP